MAEAYLNAAGKGRFAAFSAGSQPSGRVNPYALELLQKNGIDTSALRSKRWDEFERPGAPELQFVFTVCDRAAGEVCPVWPGQPVTAHWGVDDPAEVQGPDDERRRAFIRAYFLLSARIDLLLRLPLDKLDRRSLRHVLQDIGRMEPRSPGQ